MLRVLHVISGLNVGGAERMLYNICCSDRGLFIHTVISLTDLGHYGGLLKSKGVYVYELKLTRNRFNIYSIVKSLILLKNLKPNIVVGWMYHGMLFSVLLKILFFNKVSLIWNIRQSLDDMSMFNVKTKFIIYLLAKFSSFPKFIINNSTVSIMQHISIGYGSESFKYIPNGVDIQLYKPNHKSRVELRKKYGVDAKTFVVGFVGRNHKQKNFSLAI